MNKNIIYENPYSYLKEILIEEKMTHIKYILEEINNYFSKETLTFDDFIGIDSYNSLLYRNFRDDEKSYNLFIKYYISYSKLKQLLLSNL